MAKNIKLVIGIAVLILIAVVFFSTMQANDLENGNLHDWAESSDSRRSAAAQILTGRDDNNELIVACLDKMSGLPNSNKMKIRDAASLCLTGVLLKENI